MAEGEKREPIDLSEDYGLNISLQNLDTGISKILRLNSNLNEENNILKEKIKELEDNIQTLIKSNESLVELFKTLDIKSYMQTYLEKDPVDLEEKNIQSTQERESIKPPNSLKEYKDRLIETDKTNYNLLINNIKEVLSFKDGVIEDDFGEYLIDTIQDILKNNDSDMVSIELLNLIGLLYERIDEDLLIEFTVLNYQYILNIIENNHNKPIKAIITIARILYSQEQLIASDDYMQILEFRYLRPYIEKEETKIDLLLIYNHLLGCKHRHEIKYLWPEIWHKGHIECNDISNYLKVTEKAIKGEPNIADSIIEVLKWRLPEFDKIDSEVNSDIRRVSYKYMIEQLRKLINKKVVKSVEPLDTTKHISKNIVDEYFDHTLYMVKDDREDCPFDAIKLVERNIVEKTYDKLGNMKIEKNPIYQELILLYCTKCKNCFIKEGSKKNIQKHIKVIPIKKTILPSTYIDEKNETEFVLNEESPLRTRGYHTALSDNKRWDILKNSCIPELGVNIVLFYLEGFVSRFKAQKKDYSKSIEIW